MPAYIDNTRRYVKLNRRMLAFPLCLAVWLIMAVFLPVGLYSLLALTTLLLVTYLDGRRMKKRPLPELQPVSEQEFTSSEAIGKWFILSHSGLLKVAACAAMGMFFLLAATSQDEGYHMPAAARWRFGGFIVLLVGYLMYSIWSETAAQRQMMKGKLPRLRIDEKGVTVSKLLIESMNAPRTTLSRWVPGFQRRPENLLQHLFDDETPDFFIAWEKVSDVEVRPGRWLKKTVAPACYCFHLGMLKDHSIFESLLENGPEDMEDMPISVKISRSAFAIQDSIIINCIRQYAPCPVTLYA